MPTPLYSILHFYIMTCFLWHGQDTLSIPERDAVHHYLPLIQVARQTLDVDPMLGQCWASVVDGGPASAQYWHKGHHGSPDHVIAPRPQVCSAPPPRGLIHHASQSQGSINVMFTYSMTSQDDVTNKWVYPPVTSSCWARWGFSHVITLRSCSHVITRLAWHKYQVCNAGKARVWVTFFLGGVGGGAGSCVTKR